MKHFSLFACAAVIAFGAPALAQDLPSTLIAAQQADQHGFNETRRDRVYALMREDVDAGQVPSASAII